MRDQPQFESARDLRKRWFEMRYQPQFWNEDDWRRDRRRDKIELFIAVIAFLMIPVFLFIMGWIAYQGRIGNW